MIQAEGPVAWLPSKSMRCPNCSTENPQGARFCIQCATPFKRVCPKCGFENPPEARFCAQCATSLTGLEVAQSSKTATPSSSPIRVEAENLEPPSDGERKTVTVLFADIKGSMELIEDLDPEEARAIVDPALKLMMDAVHRYGGYVAQSTGDGIFALFGAPVAREDHPQRALYAALRIQEELKRYSDRIRSEGRLPVQVRVGVNTGEVVVRTLQTGEAHTEYVPIGHATSLAARMQALAPVGSIAATEPVRKLCEGYFTFKSLGPTRMKDVSEPVNVYEVLGLGPLHTRLQRSASRGLSRFVGRDAEIAQMKRALDQAKSGHGQVVAAMAEPGVGKSRLFFEFKAVAQSGCMVLEAFSISHGKASAYLPVIDLLHGYFKISAGDDRRTRREKVTGRVIALDRSLEDTLPYLFALLGIVEGADPLAQMDAQIRKRRTLEAIKRILIRESLNQPVMVIFEDLHWIDDQTQSLLNLLADSIGTAKILLLINYRPEYHHEWGSKTYYTQLRLDALGKESADKMLGAMLGDGVELALLKGLIIEKTEGNPFFMEETVEMLLDDGALVRNGSIKLVKPLAELKIPPTVQAILASRIDRLPPAEKDLLQTLAVIGREFGLGLVQRVVTESEDELNRMLHDLQFAEFIYEQPAAGDVEYTFKHALTQQVAYQSVLMERRKTLHERAAVGVETLHAGQLDDHLAELAYHYERSANLARAIDYLWRAANQASQRSLYSDAIGYVNRGLELLAATPESDARVRDELKLQMASGVALMAAKGFSSGDVERTFSRACELARTLNDPLQQFQRFGALQGLWGFHYTRHDTGAALKVAEESMTLAQNLKDDGLLKFAHYALGASLLQPGELNAARDHLERALALKDPPRFKGGIVRFGPDSNVLCLTSLSD